MWSPSSGLADWYQQGPDTFLTQQNFRTIAAQTATVAVAALGMTVIIIAGGIDLSAGTALSLAATVLAYVLLKGHSAPLAVAAAIGTGCLAGAINGILISSLRVVPFIVTLGTMMVYLGLAKRIANETTVRPPPENVPAWLESLVDDPARAANGWWATGCRIWPTACGLS